MHVQYVLANMNSWHNKSSSLTLVVQACTSEVKSSSFDLWHNKLGHSADKIVQLELNNCNLSTINKASFSIYKSCCLGKIHKFHFSFSQTTYTKLLQLVHSNLWGPSPAYFVFQWI